MFRNFPTNNVILIKPNGDKIENITAHIQSKKIFIDDTSLPIEEGDIISRKLPNGIIENYKVLENAFYNKFGSIPSHFQIKVKKETSLIHDNIAQSINNITYNMRGTNSRININSEDNSIIISNENAPIIFSELKKIIKDKIESERELNIFTKKVNEMEASLNDKSKFLIKYQEFISLAANHISIIAPFIPALTELLK